MLVFGNLKANACHLNSPRDIKRKYITQSTIYFFLEYLRCCHMKRIIFPLIALTALFSANSVFAAGDAAAGKAKAALCASCHGANGIAAAPMYPNLAGQNDAYIISSLKAFRDKSRNGGMAAIMQMQATSLSDADIDNLAAYYSSLK